MSKIQLSDGKFQSRTAAALAGLAVLAAFSVTARPAFADTMDIRKSDNSFSVDVGASYLDYAEKRPAGGSTLDSEKGWLPTVGLGVGFLSDEGASPLLRNLYGRLEGRASAGSTDYDGALQDGTPATGTTDDRVYSFAAQMGRAFPLGQDLLLTPFVEVGYRHWNRDMLGVHGYSETYTNWDAMGGLLAQYSPEHRWVLSASAAGGTTFSPQMSNYIGDFSLGDDAVWRVRGKIGYLVTDKLELTGTAEYQDFSYGISPPVIRGRIGYYEPDSTTHQTTLLAGVSYHFF